MTFKKLITFDQMELEQQFVGPNNTYISLMASELNVKLEHINHAIVIDEDIALLNPDLSQQLERLFAAILHLLEKNIRLEARDYLHLIYLFQDTSHLDVAEEQVYQFYQNRRVILNTFDSRKIIVKTLAQKRYIDALDKASIVFVTGSAGTGKTYLAVAHAVNALKKNQIRKIIITRPAVEAGEKLGFLPGDLKEKVDPYLIPIYDALYEFMGKENVDKLIEKGTIEIAPLAYMRGRTLDNAMIILDEAQNTTSNQMKMFVTRLGFNSKMIITGDVTQIDLPTHTSSGLIEATRILEGIEGIEHIHFGKYDVMRHPLVSKIIEKYEESYD